MEDQPYSEKSPVMPRLLTYILIAVLASTLGCMAFQTYVMDSNIPGWTIIVSAAIFAVIVLMAWIMELDVMVDGSKVEVRHMFKTYIYLKDEILDKKHGELSDIKNYSPWNLKGVKHKTFVRIGDDEGVAIKLKGKRVIVISSKDHETLFASIPTEAPEESQDA